jgi:Spy/CpxP family protein refolding chaperone
MRTRGYIVGVAFITLSLLGALTVYGDPGGRRGGHHFGHGGGGFPFRVLHALDLTEAQQQQVDAITKAREETVRNLRKELYTVNNEVTDKLLASGEVTTDSFTSAVDRVAALEAQLYKERLDMAIEVRKVLTADQLAKAADIMAKKRERRAEWKKSAQSESEEARGSEQGN